MSYIIKIIVIGAGATLIVDTWVYFLGLFRIKSLDYRFVGRWISCFPKGKFLHKNIMKTEPVKGELFLGWLAHYLIGINLAALISLFYGKSGLKIRTFILQYYLE